MDEHLLWSWDRVGNGEEILTYFASFYTATNSDKLSEPGCGEGRGEEELLRSMADYMSTFKQLLDTCSRGEMDLLCQRYDGFYRFARLLETLAQGIADGTIPVPPEE